MLNSSGGSWGETNHLLLCFFLLSKLGACIKHRDELLVRIILLLILLQIVSHLYSRSIGVVHFVVSICLFVVFGNLRLDIVELTLTNNQLSKIHKTYEEHSTESKNKDNEACLALVGCNNDLIVNAVLLKLSLFSISHDDVIKSIVRSS
jgi:hypothetical protein